MCFELFEVWKRSSKGFLFKLYYCDCRYLNFVCFFFHCSRNSIVDGLAKLSLYIDFRVWIEEVPYAVTNLVHHDVITYMPIVAT